MPSSERLRFRGGLTPKQVSEAIQERVASDPAGSLVEAERAFHEAQAAKQEANAARNRMRREMFRYEEFKRNLELMGVEVIFEPGPEERVRLNHRHQAVVNHQDPRRSK